MKAMNQEVVSNRPKIYSVNSLKTTGDLESKIVNFKLYGNFYNLILNIKNIESNNYRIFIEKSRLSIIIAENHFFVKPPHLHNIDGSSENNQFSYEVMRHVEVLLPADNFYLLRHFLDVEEGNLKIILKDSRLSFN